ncbi:hypothetical protein [Colwellia sp. TT2012]|uniref:hypothetical protein n=1 Tax=Colwellia sp. TT2012 TaxID=1720342 RepID=UPI000A7CFE43|nr:hypothetical protein [Colwellia sp. TT2012]
MKTLKTLQTLKSWLAGSILLTLLGCESSEDSSGTGYVKLYNLSKYSPSIYLTIDEDITEDNDEDEHFEQTYTAIAYGTQHSCHR